MKYFLVLFFFAMSFLMSCTSSNRQTPAANQSSEFSQGQIVFESNCIPCHGKDGKLNVLGAKDLTLSTLSKEEITTIITNGKNTMTPFGSILSQEEISSVADYVQTFAKPREGK